MENVTEEPLDVNVLGRGKAKQSGDFVSDSHEERMSGDSVKSEEVVVCELNAGSRMSCGRMIDGGIGFPSLASVFEVVLKAAPFVPFESAVCKDKEEDSSDDNDDANLG